jgi:hypothetical protein
MPQQALNLEPSGEWLSKSAIAKRLKLHVQTVSSRLDDLGYEADEERSSAKNQVYWFDDEVEFAIKAAKDTFTAVNIRDRRASAKLKEIKIAEQERALVPIAEVMEISQSLTTAIYKEFAINQPKRLAGKLAKAKSAPEVSKILKADTAKFMARLRGNFAEVLA